MKKQIITALSLGGALISLSEAAVFVPIAATGWNQDIVVGAGETANTATSATLDGVDVKGDTFYGVGYNTNAGDEATGLPTGLTASTSTSGSDTVTFQLQDFNENNAIFEGGTLTLATPSAFSQLAIIGTTSRGSAAMTITVNYASGPAQIFETTGGINQDWFNATVGLTYIANGRVNATSGDFNNVNNNNPRLYQNILTLNNSSTVTSLVVTGADGGNGDARNVIMAISGIAVPEPSAFLLSLAGFVCFLRRRR